MDVNEFNKNLEQNRLEREEFWKMDENFKSKYKSGNLPNPNIQWHKKALDIDLSLQRDKFHPKLLGEGFTLIPNINIEALFDQMTEYDAAMFRERKLYSKSSNDQSITSVLGCWFNNMILIPPTIMIFDQEYIDEICRGGIPSHEFRPIDGKHRLKVSYYFGETELPILVLKRQEQLIRQRLGV